MRKTIKPATTRKPTPRKTEKRRKEKGRGRTQADGHRSRRHRQSHSVAADSVAQLLQTWPSARAGVLFLAEGPAVGRSSEDPGPPIRALWRFTTEKRQTEEILSGLTELSKSRSTAKNYSTRGRTVGFWRRSRELKPGSPDANPGKPVNNRGMMASRRSARRLEADVSRDLAHAARFPLRPAHAWTWISPRSKRSTSRISQSLASRDEFTYLCDEMLGEVQVGHMFVSGPRQPSNAPKPGLLGADYTIEHNRYRFRQDLQRRELDPVA